MARTRPQKRAEAHDGPEAAEHIDQAVSGQLIPAGVSESPTKPNLMADVLARFLRRIDDYRDATNIALPHVARLRHSQVEAVIAKFKTFEEKQLEDGSTAYQVDLSRSKELLDTGRELDRLLQSGLLPALARSIFIGIFSEYDSFVGSLLKVIYLSQPELFRGIKREIALVDLLTFGDLEAVKADMLEKEIDAVRRESYVEQFAQFERKFGFTTLRDFPEWPLFVEMSQRRNLMTHNDGCVSGQYLTVCDREKYKFKDRPCVGEELKLTPAYLSKTLLVISKMGFMLTHTLWRKILLDETAEANAAMNNEIYDLLLRKRWLTASEFGQFALSAPMLRGATDIEKRIRLCNTAIALKQLKRADEAIALLDSQDWSASLREFTLANAVLKEDYKAAAQLMRDIGKKGEMISQVSYHDWPLFEVFRDAPEFHHAYEAIYGRPFAAKAAEDAQSKSEELRKEVKAEAVASEEPSPEGIPPQAAEDAQNQSAEPRNERITEAVSSEGPSPEAIPPETPKVSGARQGRQSTAAKRAPKKTRLAPRKTSK